MNAIQCSTNYEQFRFHSEQRALDASHILQVQKSMQKHGFIPSMPIVVDSDFRILDGQHRYQAAKNLGLPIYFVIQDGLSVDGVRDLAKTVRPWRMDDYVTSLIRQGNESYKRLRALKEESGLSWDAFLPAAVWRGYAGGEAQKKREEFKSGGFVLTERKEAEIREFLTQFAPFRKFFPKGWSHAYFVNACGFLFSHSKYDHKQMLSRLEYQSTRLVRCASTREYIALLTEIYNYKSHLRNVVDFDFRGRYLPGDKQ